VYLWLWHHLPGGTAAKAGAVTILALAVAALLWCYLFPWAASTLPLDGTGFGG
jgi:hypothetical protein